MSVFEGIGFDFLGRSPYMLAWLVALFFAVFMVRWGGGKAEKILLAGCNLMFFAQLIAPFLSGLTRWAISERSMPVATTGIIYSLPVGIVSMAGIICLVYAFWIKFKAKKIEVKGTPQH